MFKQATSRYTIITTEEVHSTNSHALDNFSFFSDGTVVFAKNQTDGRGRYNRKWISDGSENLYVSFVFKPTNIESYPFSNLTQYLSVILCKFLENAFALKPEIKWPNDILINGSKISGILAEAYSEKNEIKGIVLGLGLNVNLKKETLDKIDQKATSIAVLKNEEYGVDGILKEICDLFFASYDDFVKCGFKLIKNDYISRCGFLGKNITIKDVKSIKNGLAKSIDDDGLLVIEENAGNESKIITGDVLC